MTIRKILFRFLPPALILVFLASAAVFFFSRAPVVIVTDLSFNLLYGSRRTRLKQAENSLRLLRPVRTVTIAEGAGPDLVAVSVESGFKSPYAVLFPYRYEAGAFQYMEKNPDIPVVVLGGRIRRNRREPGPALVRTDTALDYYRAGRAAALLSGENQGDIIFFYDGTMSDGDRKAFGEGLKAAEDSRNPVYINVYSDYGALQNAACVLVNGSAGAYFEQNLKLPAVLFSWIDPEMTPSSVKLIFDDSPWAHVYGAVKAAENRESELFLPSELVVPEDRFEDKELAEKIAGLYLETPGEAQNP